MKKILFIFLFLFPALVFSQATIEKRVEVELNDGYDEEVIYQFGEKGFIIASFSDNPINGYREWKYDLYDTDMNRKKTIIEKVDEKLGPATRFASDDKLYVFYKNRKGNFKLQSIDAEDLNVTSVDGFAKVKGKPKSFCVMGDYAYVVAKTKKSSFIIAANLSNGASSVMPVRISGYSNKDVYVTHLEAMPQSKQVFAYVRCIAKKKSDMYIMRLGETGDQKDMIHISYKLKKSINSISGTAVGDNKHILAGTFARKASNTAQGIFISQVTDDHIDYFKMHEFINLKNFYARLSERKKKKIEKAEKKGKEYSHQIMMAPHNVIPVTDGYIFIGESYYPTYRTETYTYVVNGRTVTGTRQVFDGYQYTDAIIVKYNDKGEVIWDESFVMHPFYKPFTVIKFIKVGEMTDESISLVFCDYNQIVSKKIDYDGKVISNRQIDIQKPNDDNEKIKFTFSNISYWYGNYFLTYGMQVTKNNERKLGERRRKIFFMSKLSY